MESYAKGETQPPLLEETIGANFDRTVAAHADREALVEVASGRRWTWAELDRDVDALARGLVRAGIGKGDRVGIWAPNCAEWTLTQYADRQGSARSWSTSTRRTAPTSWPTPSTSRAPSC